MRHNFAPMPTHRSRNDLLTFGLMDYSFCVSMPPDDEDFMRAALREARRSLGRTSPNPAVGAVLVVQNQIVARGHHQRAGLPHAEVDCLRNFGRTIPNSAVLYVTLEPCSTVGRTPACTDEIIRYGVKTVVIGSIDVNPRHSGRGLELLRNAGIEVRTNILGAECAALNEAFNKWIVTGQPFIIAKCGMSLDGRLVRPPTESRWITSAAARRHARRLRAEVDAILVDSQDRQSATHRSRRGRRGATAASRSDALRQFTASRPNLYRPFRPQDPGLPKKVAEFCLAGSRPEKCHKRSH